MINLTQCIKCTHRIRGRKCSAYPDGVPFKIFSGEIPHDQVFDGQVEDYVYNPKDKYIIYDLEREAVKSLPSSYVKALESEITQLFYDNLSSQGLFSNGWNFAKLDFELLGNYGGRINELYVITKGEKVVVDKPLKTLLIDKLTELLKANNSHSNRVKLTMQNDCPAVFKFIVPRA